MYSLASTSVVIERPRVVVFDYVSNHTNFAEWFPGVVEVKSRDQVAHATVGKEYDETLLTPLRGRQSVVIRVTEVAPPRKFVTEGSLPLLMPRMEIELHDIELNTCRVQWRMLSRSTTPLARWTVLPLAGLATQKRADAAMRRLKKILECAFDPKQPCTAQDRKNVSGS
ncbi:SRPBCC family protein [Caenimonas sedimenti]|uniref:SRPBCC family protein n=1 Tax=Caenimonas sedimenti TaxID=2596921 RepID=A0A562ZQS8_9BURK|nr:SRPBCC family protein [Caenimonas sedimenti]TWO70645.1 SRPBCC family protein [Caenimonas sedimenti]